MYYLPININGRRLHFLKLSEKTVDPVFSFVVKDEESPTLLSIEVESPQLISTEGRKHNESLFGYMFTVAKMEEKIDELNAYEVKIVKGSKSKDAKEHSGDLFLKTSGFMGADDSVKYASVKIDSTLNRTDADKIKESAFVLVVSYENAKTGKIYRDAIKIHLYLEEGELVSTALDFGSEASQVRVKGVDTNCRIIREFLKFGEYPAPSYWQGSVDDQFYKSIFFINTKPGITNYGDRPKVGDESAFVRPLMAVNERNYSNLELLPNLKLVEIGRDQIRWQAYDIELSEESKIEVGATPTLASEGMRNSILRLILSNFLHCILSQTCARRNRYVRMVLLVPNVYYQSKVYRLMDNLYRDFREIQKSSTPYKHCKGFEVQVVSESDASFIGVMSRRPDLAYYENSYYLIIDAGKGTTDFSILKSAKDNRREFSSLYRDGIPASGNVITYAFYEALKAFMDDCGVPIENYLSTAQSADVLQFANLLDILKKNYSINPNSAEFNRTNNNDIRDMASLIQYLMDGINSGKKIPLCAAYVNRKVRDLTKSLEYSLTQFMSTNKIKFTHALLAGRGFLFDPFKQAVIEMLERNGWIEEGSDVRIDGDEAKSLCLHGALAIEKECSVNCNSGLIGSPIITTGKKSAISSWFAIFSKKIGSRNGFKPLDMEFFYDGSSSSSSKQLDILIGGRKYMFDEKERVERSIFFVGEGFLYQSEDNSKLIDEKNFDFASDLTARLVPEALFPFNIASIAARGAQGASTSTRGAVTPGTTGATGSTKDKNNDDLDR